MRTAHLFGIACLLMSGCDARHIPKRNVTPVCALEKLRVGDPVTAVRAACGLPSYITSWIDRPDSYQWAYGDLTTSHHNQVYVNDAGYVTDLQAEKTDRDKSPDSTTWYSAVQGPTP